MVWCHKNCLQRNSETDNRTSVDISLKVYLLNQEKNTKNYHYPFLFDHDFCPRDIKDMALKELYDAVAATKESLIAKKKNLNHFEIKEGQRRIIANVFLFQAMEEMPP